MQINLSRTVAARPLDAFETVANVPAWPDMIRSILSIESVDALPLRVGSRLRIVRIMFGRAATQELEVATLDRPRRLRFIVTNPDIHYELDHVIDAVYGGGTRMMLIFRSRPQTDFGHAAHPFLTPFLEITLRDELERDLEDLAAAAKAQSSIEHARG